MELLLKTHELVKYITERYNKEFCIAGNNYSPLVYKEAKFGEGYLIYFKSNHIYFDFRIKPEIKDLKEPFARYVVGTYFLKLLDERYDFNHYYYYFLQVVLAGFKKQSDNEEIYGLCEDTSMYIKNNLKRFTQSNMTV